MDKHTQLFFINILSVPRAAVSYASNRFALHIQKHCLKQQQLYWRAGTVTHHKHKTPDSHSTFVANANDILYKSNSKLLIRKLDSRSKPSQFLSLWGGSSPKLN